MGPLESWSGTRSGKARGAPTVTGGFFLLRDPVAAILAIFSAWGFLRGPSAPLGVTPVPSARSLRTVAFSPGLPGNAARISRLSRPAGCISADCTFGLRKPNSGL